MEAKSTILEIANELRDCFGCAYGCCYEVSIILAAKLRKAGLKPKVIKGTFTTDLDPVAATFVTGSEYTEGGGGGDYHCWVTCAGFLIDLTADQFNDEIEDDEMPEIYCVPIKLTSWRYKNSSKKREQEITAFEALCEILGNVPKKVAKRKLVSLRVS